MKQKKKQCLTRQFIFEKSKNTNLKKSIKMVENGQTK